MKQFISLICMALISSASFAQNSYNSRIQKKRFSSGFNLGVNHANLLASEVSHGTIDNGIGFRIGLVSDFAFTKRISLQPKAELSFNNIKFRSGFQEMAVVPLDLELMTHFKVRLKPCPLSLFFVFGPNVKIPLNSDNSGTLPTRQDLALDLGIGYDLSFARVRISPELRYSIGLLNITESSSISDLHFHNISLLLNFTGRPRL